MIGLNQILKMLCERRPIFHSEADFQHALAWQIHEQWPRYSVRLEYPLYPGQRDHLDILARSDAAVLAIELKYKTRTLFAPIGGELFWLKDQSAQDCGRYDFLNDIQRLEQFVLKYDNVVGYAILLTNDSSYWNLTQHDSSADVSFRIHDGRLVTGILGWGPTASKGTTKGREKALALEGTYRLIWRDYYEVEANEYVKDHRKFRYLALKVDSTHIM